jgi:hypothetical protein
MLEKELPEENGIHEAEIEPRQILVRSDDRNAGFIGPPIGLRHRATRHGENSGQVFNMSFWPIGRPTFEPL